MAALPQGIHFTVEVPFPNDLAPFKVIRTGTDGNRRIVDSAQTLEAAEALALQAWDDEQDWYAISNGLENGDRK